MPVVLVLDNLLEHEAAVDIQSLLDTRLLLSKDLKYTCIILNVRLQLQIRAYLMQLSVRSLTFRACNPHLNNRAYSVQKAARDKSSPQ